MSQFHYTRFLQHVFLYVCKCSLRFIISNLAHQHRVTFIRKAGMVGFPVAVGAAVNGASIGYTASAKVSRNETGRNLLPLVTDLISVN